MLAPLFMITAVLTRWDEISQDFVVQAMYFNGLVNDMLPVTAMRICESLWTEYLVI